MPFDGVAEQDAIIARAQTFLGGRFYDGIPDETILDKDENGDVLPYGVVWFGEMYDVSSNDRSIAGEEQQPATMSVTIEVWATTSTAARQAAGPIRVAFRGWSAGDNMTPMAFRGSGSFQNRDSTGLPSRFMRSITFTTTLNMVVDLDASPS